MIDLNMEVKGTTYEEQKGATNQTGYELLPEGVYDVRLDKFGDWELTVSKDGDEYYKVDVELVIVDGEFKNRRVFDTVRNHPNTTWKVENFLGCFAGDGVSAPLSKFKDYVGEVGKISIVHAEGTPKIERDEFGLEHEIIPVYANVKSYLVSEPKEKTPW